MLSFRAPYSSFSPLRFNSAFTDFANPIIAPLWTELIFTASGTLTYRSTMDASTLNATVEMLASRNSELHDFQPLMAFIATWNDVAPYRLHNLKVNYFVATYVQFNFTPYLNPVIMPIVLEYTKCTPCLYLSILYSLDLL